MPESKEEVITNDDPVPEDLPGQPRASDVKADSVKLVWEKTKVFRDADYYQISYKERSSQKWTFYKGEYDIGNVDVNDLKADTEYIFRVRVVHRDCEGPHSKESETIKTVVSPAAKMVSVCNMVIPGKPSPSVYGVPIKEISQSRNETAKTKKFEVGQYRADITEEKTIMLVGATGTGKSTLVNGLLNYILGVQWNDPFRFTIVDVTEEEKENAAKSQAVSQTEWITCYIINPDRGSRLEYRLNIIDTPGFGDTRGVARDRKIVDQIRALFTEEGPKGVPYLDAVCFLIKAPDARLTAIQSYIFEQIMSLFGNNVIDNICSLITFADGNDPPVLAALEASKLPFGKHFTFNNSGLFTKNKDLGSTSLSPLFWEMGLKSFKSFFEHLRSMQKKSLQLTVAVLEEREKLENTVQILQPQVELGLSKLNSFKQEIRIIEQHKTDAKANKNFTYEVEEFEQLKTDLPKGQHVTNCLNCNFTCHKNCKLPNDDQKERCIAMGKDGNCQYCPDKCFWKKHVNSPYIFDLKKVKKKKTYKEKLQKYQEAEGKVLNHAQVIGKMKQELEEYTSTIEHFMNEIRICNEKLSLIALRPNPLSMKEYFELIIKAEKMEQKEGYMERISMLEEMKSRAQITDKAKRFKDEFKEANKSFTCDLSTADDSEESKWTLKALFKGLVGKK